VCQRRCAPRSVATGIAAPNTTGWRKPNLYLRHSKCQDIYPSRQPRHCFAISTSASSTSFTASPLILLSHSSSRKKRSTRQTASLASSQRSRSVSSTVHSPESPLPGAPEDERARVRRCITLQVSPASSSLWKDRRSFNASYDSDELTEDGLCDSREVKLHLQ
jgi:hypothetical protein